MNTCGVNKVDEWNELPPVQTSVESTQLVEVPCYTSLPRDDQTSLEFRLDKTDTALDPSSLCLHVKLQIRDADGNKIPLATSSKPAIKTETENPQADAKEEVEDFTAVTNLFAYSMFSSVDVFISDQKINQGTTYYPWMCYVLNLLYQSQDAKKTSLQSAGWYPDTTFLFEPNIIPPDTFLNSGYKTRWSMSYASQTIELFSRVMLDTVFPARVLPVQTEFTLRFNPADPKLCLMNNKETTFKIRILEAKLYAQKLRLTEQALQRQQQILASDGVNYPMTRYDTRTITMMKGAQNLDWVPVTGVMPQKVYIFQVSQEAFNGKITKNPFYFQTFGLNKVQVLVNDRSMICSQATTFEQSDNNAALYMNTVMNTTEAPFSSWDFTAGYCVVVVDLTRDRSAGCNYVSEPVNGSLRILIDYEEALKESIVVFCMSEFYNVLHLDANRNPSWT